jgi:N-acetylglutamate synthase-like GNAT family acetyltransferase
LLSVRQATETDRTVISEISKHYDSNLVHLMHNTWMQQGSLYIAEADGTVIGFCCLTFPAPTEAQILGIRLRPEYRKESLGRQFVIALLHLAQERGCNIVRTLTSAENWETQAALQRNLDFERRGSWVVAYREKLRKKFCSAELIEPAAPALLDEIWDYLQYSLTYRRSEGLIFGGDYTLRGFTKAYLAKLLAEGQVYVCQEGEMVAGVAVASCQGDTMVLRYVDARPHVILELLQGIICSKECDCQFLTSAVPADTYGDAKPYLEHCVENHVADRWLVMEKEVLPLALPRE